jgi:hypothetical protein
MVDRDDSTVHQPGSTIHTFKQLLLVVLLLLVDGGGSTTGGGVVVPTGVLESILFAESCSCGPNHLRIMFLDPWL